MLDTLSSCLEGSVGLSLDEIDTGEPEERRGLAGRAGGDGNLVLSCRQRRRAYLITLLLQKPSLSTHCSRHCHFELLAHHLTPQLTVL